MTALFYFVLSANEAIADVRSKLKAEASALEAQLRREQLKAQSLEKNLDQKVSTDVKVVVSVFTGLNNVL